MTTFKREGVNCAVCEMESEQYVLVSTSSFGLPDLDLRPAPLERETLAFTVQRCPNCGYCAANIGQVVDRPSDVVKTNDYQAQLEDAAYPELARQYLCAALVEAQSQPGRAAWAALQAAWVCDDEAAIEAALQCRVRASAFFQAARAAGVPFCEQKTFEQLVLADVMRRAGLFEEALAECDAGLALEPEDIALIGLRLERELASVGDSGCHTFAEGDHEISNAPRE